MLAMSVLVRPCNARETRSSSGRVTSSVPSSCATSMGAATEWLSRPLGPLTVTCGPSIETSTPAGTVMGSLPMRDMLLLLSLDPGSPDEGEDFPADALLVGLPVGEQAGRRRQDRDAEAAQHAGQVRRLGVDPQAGLADAADAGDRALPVRAVLEGHREGLAHLGVGHGPRRDVALLLEDLGDVGLELAVRHV